MHFYKENGLLFFEAVLFKYFSLGSGMSFLFSSSGYFVCSSEHIFYSSGLTKLKPLFFFIFPLLNLNPL